MIFKLILIIMYDLRIYSKNLEFCRQKRQNTKYKIIKYMKLYIYQYYIFFPILDFTKFNLYGIEF